MDKQPAEQTIDFDDIPVFSTQKNPLDFLPEHLRKRAEKLTPERAYTVLELKDEGDGHNASLLSVAATCYRMGISYEDTLEHLQAAYSADRIDYEIAPVRAVKRVWGAEGDLRKLTDCDAESAPDAKEENLIRFRRTPVSSIVEISPATLATPALDIVNHLFEEMDIINIQHTALEYGTLVVLSELPAFLEKHRCPLEDYKFLNPATFKKVEGVPNPLHAQNKVSTRCNENVKTRRWMVLEMDSKEEARLERFNTFVLAMAQFAPLVLAVDTGNKSIHFWFDTQDIKPKIRTSFFNMACLHGADKRLGVKSQIARMPNVPSADTGRGPQKVVYYDPDRELANEWDLKGFENFLQQNRQLDYFYHGKNRNFMTRDNLESWVSLDRTSLRSHLAGKGYREQKVEGENLSPIDGVINSIQLDKNVEAVIPGASGRHAGVYEENGHRIIVTKSPSFIKARRGDWSTIKAFLEGLFGHEEDQLEVFFGWLADAIKNLRNEGKRRANWSPRQMIHIMGPTNAGKTLILQDLLTPCFANRSASADPLFKKNPDMHNADTFACELLYLDDSPVLESNYHFRQEFGERIKSHVVGIGGGIRDMQQSRVNIRPWWCFVRLMNMEPATFATLPPLDEGVEDKLIFLRGEKMPLGPLGPEMKLPGWYGRIKHRIQTELPAFIHFLLEEFSLPEHLNDPEARYPVMSYKNPQVMSDIEDGSPEANLVYKFDHDAKGALFGGPEAMFDDEDDVVVVHPWQGTSEQLYDILCATGSRGSQNRFSKTCPNPRVLISQLRSLEKSRPDRVGYSRRLDGYKDKKHGAEYWVIFPKVETERSIEDML